jgi:hypothetical protein
MILGFGPLPAEFTSNGMIQVSQYTTLRRALLVGKAAGAKFVFVTVAYEGGVLIGAVVNKFLPEETKAAIGGSSVRSSMRAAGSCALGFGPGPVPAISWCGGKVPD